MYKPLRDNIIVEKLEKDLTTASGIILKSNDDADKAKVIAIGPDVTDVALNEVLLVNWNKAKKIENDTYQINIQDVIGVFD
jgi:co-chaperonin GroES (HSP10)